jgi:glutathione S-transferase
MAGRAWDAPGVAGLTLYDFAAWHAEGERALQTLDTHLKSAKYMVSDHFTIADIGLYAYAHLAEEADYRLADYPALSEWIERVTRERGVLPIGTNPEASV